MASDQLIITKINEGPKRAVFHIFMNADGTGELQDEIVIDPDVDFIQPAPKPYALTLMKVWYSHAIFDVTITFDGVDQSPAWVTTPSTDTYTCFEYFGGIKARSIEQPTGKIMISTNGFTTPGSVGVLILEVKKD